MPEMNPNFARRLLLSIGISPEIFIQEVKTPQDADFFITEAIKSRDKFYHPDSGMKKDSRHFQKWSETKGIVRHFSSWDIYNSVKSMKGKRKVSADTQIAVDETQKNADLKTEGLMKMFAVGTYQRALADNLADTYLIINNVHKEYGHSGVISIDSFLNSGNFQEVLDNESKKQGRMKILAKKSAMNKEIFGINERINEYALKRDPVWQRRISLISLESILKKAGTYEDLCKGVEEYSNKLEEEITEMGLAGELKQFEDAENRQKDFSAKRKEIIAEERRKIINDYTGRLSRLKRELSDRFSEEEESIRQTYLQKISSLKKRLEKIEEGKDKIEIKQSNELYKIALNIERNVQKGHGVRKNRSLSSRKWCGKNEDRYNLVNNMFGLAKDMDLVLSIPKLAASIENHAGKNQFHPSLPLKIDELKSAIVNTTQYSEMLKKMDEVVGQMKKDVDGSKERLLEKNYLEKTSNQITADLLSKLPNDLGISYIQSRDLVRALAGRASYNEARKIIAECANEEGYEFKPKKRYILSKLRGKIASFDNTIRGIDMNITSLKKRGKSISREMKMLGKNPAEEIISENDAMNLFLKNSSNFIKGVYGRSVTETPTFSPSSILYIDKNMNIHYFNVSGTEEDAPSLKDFKGTKRRVAAILKTKEKVQRYLSRQNPSLYLLPQSMVRKVQGDVLPIDAIVKSRAYEDFAEDIGENYSIISVESSKDHGEVFRIEGQTISGNSKSLDRLLNC
jgi:hypothetical protein